MTATRPGLSVIIATYNRGDAAERLLLRLATQTLSPASYEVVLVDDGSTDPVAPRFARLRTPYRLRVLTQENGGPAVARNAGIQAALGDIIVIVDDDMEMGDDFLAAHLDAHPADSRRAVLGRITTDPGARLPLFERYQAAMLDRFARGVRDGTVTPRGWHLYTGNVSFRRADFVAVGGFDPSLRLSEDAELGIRLERSGVAITICDRAVALHASDHVELGAWMRRSFAYGIADSGIAEKHAEMPSANPWRFLFLVNRVSRPLLLTSVLAPAVMGPVAWLAIRIALGLARLGAERLAIAATTFVYGVQYFRGVRKHAGSRRIALGRLMRYLTQRSGDGLGVFALMGKLVADLRADHAAVLHADARYRGKTGQRPRLLRDLVERVGFQMMFAYRVMRFFRAAGMGFAAKISARMIRHLYAADIHWDAELAPGVMIVHGIGLVIGHGARVGPGCVLFHGVTLGENIHPETREVGAPALEANVHVGPGATLLGPIVIGERTKITAGALVTQSVPAGCLVETAAPVVRGRSTLARAVRLLPALSLFVLSASSCGTSESAPAAAVAVVSGRIVEPVFDGRLAAGWELSGSAPHEITEGAPIRVDLSGERSWAAARPGLANDFGTLVFRYAGPPGVDDLLEVRLDSRREEAFPSIAVTSRRQREVGDGFAEVVIPVVELNPEGRAFDRIVWRATRRVRNGWVRFDKIGFTAFDSALAILGSEPGRQPVDMTIDCTAPGHAISPLIYGIAFDPRLDRQDRYAWKTGATARRWGGNPSSRYNWELGNAWNTGSDWYFRNVNFTGDPRFSYEQFLDANRVRGVRTALTLPMLGHVAKDTLGYSFPVSERGEQRSADPWRSDAGDGNRPDGKALAPRDPLGTSIAAPPEMIGRWVSAIRAADASRGRSVDMYILDNEPSLWSSTHRDVHPEPTTYDELLAKTIAYGTAVRRADPEAVIAGPAEWGWPGYLYSGADAAAGFRLRPDRRRHGDVPLLPWYLRQLRDHERATGVRVLDVVDLHFYPQARGVFGPDGGTDSTISALRLRSTRALWDSAYVDESWIADTVRLIPRLREWIAANNPGLGISIGEWNFGAERHISGGLAVAEALGRFAQTGITSAFYWTYPPEGSPAFTAFRAFRNYDGKGRAFLDRWVPTRAPGEGHGVSLFASRDSRATTVVAVALNLNPSRSVVARLDHRSCGRAVARRQFTYSAGDTALTAVPVAASAGTAFQTVLAPYSITVLELSLAPSPSPSSANGLARSR